MTFGKASALAMGLLGAMAIGIWIGPHVMHSDGAHSAITTSAPAAEESPSVNLSKPLAEKPAAPVKKAAPPPAADSASALLPSSPELHKRLKPLLNEGADMTIAAQGFTDAEQFAAVAHAARNTSVPFMLLKHHVVDQGQSLTVALRASKPTLNAAVEANRAQAEAKSDVVALGGSTRM